jgi:glycosyltransferase involved in cell wall biosynthesis
MVEPRVSVICLCYNHARYVHEAIQSVLQQTYRNIELIIVDDASEDESVAVIKRIIKEHSYIKFLPLHKNSGICKAFNQGLALATGDFIIDFSADDVMLPHKINHQIKLFHTLGQSFGVVFTDAVYVNEQGNVLHKHYEYLKSKHLVTTVPQGDVYQQVVSTYFIASPTMMVRRKVFDVLQGYDETLVYEDFDFWIRSSRLFKYAYLDEVTTKIRVTQQSMSTGWYRKGDKQLHSTYLVCRKALKLNRSKEDDLALAKRLKYELRQSVFSENHEEANLFYELLVSLNQSSFVYGLLHYVNKLRLPLSGLRRLYHYVRFS